jgi:N-methylhydantoinase A
LSAFGAATSDLRLERVWPVAMTLPGDTVELAGIEARARAAAESDLDREGVEASRRALEVTLDLRFAGQVHDLEVPMPPGDDAAKWHDAITAFREAYALRFGRGSLGDAPVELVSLRAIGVGRCNPVGLGPGQTDGASARLANDRRAVRHRSDTVTDVSVSALGSLEEGQTVEGPWLLDGLDTTVWVPPGMRATPDKNATLVMEVGS